MVAADNLRQSFPHLSVKELDDLVWKVFLHFCTMVIEIVHIPRKMHVHNWRQYFELGDPQRTMGGLISDRPLLIVVRHFGNWELAGFAVGLLGLNTYAIARTLDNPFLDDYFRRFREGTGQKVLAKKGDFDKIQGILAKGGVIATMGDQDAGQRGLFVDFFGRPASTHKAIALLALEHRVPMLVAGNIRVDEPMRYRLDVADLILPEEYDGRPDAVRAITQRFTTAMERLIRMAPEQYFWLHRRWKHQPQARKGKKAA